MAKKTSSGKTSSGRYRSAVTGAYQGKGSSSAKSAPKGGTGVKKKK